MNSTPKIALVAGATGLVGGTLLNVLLEAPDYARTFAVTRRPFGREHPRLANRVVVFPRMAEQLKGLVANDAYCCIGTTIADAGTQEAFREADLDMVLTFAQAARSFGVTRFIVVSSVGADTRSKNFYLRTKGEMEDAITAVGFPSVDILQPSLLLGPRKQVRPLELAGRIFAPVVNPFLTG
ncbi:MAG: Nucleoside-diphosphate-sugar epimerase, partial [Steroidobacteraceae bacterium]|nr:Nucleoside-diphosphate-sugar epimerase [Steroidobacteraceae bacterium]